MVPRAGCHSDCYRRRKDGQWAANTQPGIPLLDDRNGIRLLMHWEVTSGILQAQRATASMAATTTSILVLRMYACVVVYGEGEGLLLNKEQVGYECTYVPNTAGKVCYDIM